MNQRKCFKWDEGIFIILILIIVSLPFIFFDYSIPAFTPIKDLSLQLLVLFGIAIWALKIITVESIYWQKNDLNKPIFLYLIFGSFSLIWSVNIYHSVLILPLFLAGAILFFIITNSVCEQKSIDKLLFIIIIIGLCLGIYGILQYYGIDFRVWDRDIGRQRVMGQFGNVNYFAEYLILPLSLTVGLFLAKNKIFNKFFLLLALLAMGSALFFTFTRGSYLAIVVTISLILFLYFKSAENEQTKHFYKKAILLFLLFIIIVLALIYIPHPLNREGTALGKLKSRTTIDVLMSGSSTLRRIAIWKCTWMMIEDYPILGSGLGTYAYHTLKYQAEFFSAGNNRDIYPYGNAVQAHNEYLQLWSELGVVGLLLFVYIIFTYYRSILKNIKRMDEKEKTITIGLVGGVTAVLIDAIFGFPLQLSASMSLFWIFLGLTVCQINAAIGDKKETAFIEKDAHVNKKEVSKKDRIRISFLETTNKKRIAYTMVIVLVIICFLFLIRPFIARVYYYYGNDLITKKDKNNEAIGLYKTGIRMNPWLGDLYYKIGINLSARRQFDLALEYYHKAEKYMDDQFLPRNIALVYLSKEEYDKAIPYFKKAINYQKNRKDMVPLQLQLANIYLTIDDYQNAEHYFNDVIIYNPKNIEAYYGLGEVYINQGKQEQAIEVLQKVIEIAPESELADTARTMLTDLKKD